MKCSCLSVSSLICFGPLNAKLIYEVTTGKPLLPELDAVVATFVALDQAITPIFLYLFDNSLRNSIHEFFGLSSRRGNIQVALQSRGLLIANGGGLIFRRGSAGVANTVKANEADTVKGKPNYVPIASASPTE